MISPEREYRLTALLGIGLSIAAAGLLLLGFAFAS